MKLKQPKLMQTQNDDQDPTVLVGTPNTNNTIANKKSTLSGIGGWLRFLIFWLMVLIPFIALVHINYFFKTINLVADSHWGIFKTTYSIIEMVLAAISIVAGYKLWKKHFSESVKFAILALWMIGPVGNLIEWTCASLTVGRDANGIMHFIGSPIVSILMASIWTAYLLRSDRVKNTYHIDD